MLMDSPDEHARFSNVLQSVLTNSFKSLDLLDVARLAASNNEAKEQCSHCLSAQRTHWLKVAVRNGHAQAVSRLAEDQLDLLPAVSNELFSTPNLSLEVACERITLGLSPTYEQIAAHARQGVPGVYIWARAFRQLQRTSGMPPQAAALCYDQALVGLVGLC